MKWNFIPIDKTGIVPTTYGLAYFTLVVDIFALGYFRNSGPHHTVGLTLIVLGMVAMIQSNSNMDAVTAEIVDCEPGEEGGRALVTVLLRNNQKEPRYNLSLAAYKHPKLITAPLVAALKTNATVRLEYQCPKRGIYPLQRIRLQSRGIHSLFFAWKWLLTDAQLIVYPRPDGVQSIPELTEAGAPASSVGDDFIGHRFFQVGASLKQVDWKAYARGQDILLKDFGAPLLGPAFLRYQDVQADEAEAKLKQLAAWIFACTRENRSFSLELPKQFLPEGQGQTHLHAALRLLAEYEVRV